MSITLDQFKTTTANEYGEAFGLIGLVPDSPAYQLENEEYVFTIGFTDEGEWVCQIDELEYFTCAACWQGSTPQEALENACVEAVSYEEMSEFVSIADGMEATAAAAFAMLNGKESPATAEELAQFVRMLKKAEYIAIKNERYAMGDDSERIEYYQKHECEVLFSKYAEPAAEWAKTYADRTESDAAEAAAAASFCAAYKDATGEPPYYEEAVSVCKVAREDIAGQPIATDEDRDTVGAMVQAIAEQAETEDA